MTLNTQSHLFDYNSFHFWDNRLIIYTISQIKKNQPIYYLTIFTNPSARAGYDTRSIFKRSLTGLNSEFSFS